MSAYIVFIKEREHDSAAMAEYAGKAGQSMAGHTGKPLAFYGAIETLEDYKRVLETFDDFGIPYTFGTDSPSLQGTSLAAELLLLLESGAATSEQVLRALRVADQRTFLNGQA